MVGDTLEDINKFLEKATILERTVRDIANGTLCENEVSLKEYGILTAHEMEEEEELKVKKRNVCLQKEKEHEARKWWDAATILFGPKLVYENTFEESAPHPSLFKRSVTSEANIKKRYSCDYSRWEEKQFVPDDDATKEEELYARQMQEKVRNDNFEKENKEFCHQMKVDMISRSGSKRQEELASKKLCDRGKFFFRQESYIKSKEMYEAALKKAPYDTTTLINMAIVQGKLSCWTEVIEYCNRALHVSKNSSVKARFHRHKAYIVLNKYDNALSDLTHCCTLDPQNMYFQRCRNELDLHIQSNSLELQIISATGDAEQQNSGSRSEMLSRERPSISMEDWKFEVCTTKGDIGHESAIKKQCKIIDQCMDTIKQNGYSFQSSYKVRDDNSYETLGDLLCFFKVKTCSVARTYMRTTGYFDDIFHSLETYCIALLNKKSNVISKRERAEIVTTIGLSAEIIKNDHLSRSQLLKKKIFSSILNVAESIDTSIVMIDTFFEVFIAVSSLILTCLQNDDNSGYLECLAKNDSFIKKMCLSMSFVSKEMSKCKSKNALNLISRSAELISCLTRSKTFGANDFKLESNPDIDQFSYFGHPVQCLGFALQNMCKAHSDKFEELLLTKHSILRALVRISTIPSMRVCFTSLLYETSREKDKVRSSNSSTSGILFFLSVSPLESPQIRKLSFRVILNSLVSTGVKSESDMEHARKIVDEIQKYGGIDILVNLILHDGCPEVKQCSASLLDNFFSNNKGLKLADRQVNSLFVALVETYLAIAVRNAPSNTCLVRLLSSLTNLTSRKSHQIQWNGHSIAPILVKLLPTPHENEEGSITAASVCLPPKKSDTESVTVLRSSQAFLANLLKIIISYIDASIENGNNLVKEGAIESLICLLANSSRQHRFVTKNAATALAKLSRLKNPLAIKRCRELRGIEILIALNQSNRI